MLKNPFAQGVALIAAALVLAIVTNGFASRTRKLILPGYYPDALRLPAKAADVTPPVSTMTPTPDVPVATDTIVPGPAEVTTTTTITTAAPATATTTTAPATTTALTPTPTPTPTPAPTPAQPAEDPMARFQPHPDKAYVEISGSDAALLHSKGVLFLDARRTSVFEDGHIAGARSYSVWESDIDDKVNALFGERGDPREQNLPIVIYCSGGACEDSHMLAQKLWGIQFNNIYVYKDGFPDWQKRGGAVKTGAQP
jgi:rhodanese-related sulfurtransferase